MIGAAAPAIIRRLGPVGLVVGGGAYLAKKAWDRRKTKTAAASTVA
jgi:hypothetical protein